MIVAYDLRYATDHFPGVGTHAYRLLEALLERPGPERYHVLWNPAVPNRRFDPGPVRRHPRVEWAEIPAAPLGPRGALRVGFQLARRRPDLYFSPFYLAPIAPPGSRCPVVLTLHDVLPLTAPELFGAFARLGFRLAMARARAAAAVVTSSEFARGEILRTTSLAPARVRRIPPGAPAARRGGGDPPRPGPYALVVGINKPHKNLATLAEAWRRFGASPPLELVSAGPRDPRYPDLAEWAGRCGARSVTALGAVDEGALDALYEHAALVLFPSRHEGFGFPLAEALAHGRAVLASDIPPLRELGGDSARFVPADDAGAWHRAVGELAAAPARAGLEAAARARAAGLSYAACADAMLALWRGIAA